MKKHYLIFTVTLFFQFSFSQTEKLIHGKVLNEDFPVQGVKVINLNTEKSIITNNNGDFSIMVKPEDMLVFYELEYNYKRKQVTEKEIYDDYIVIKLEKKPVTLDEVVVQKPNFDIPKYNYNDSYQTTLEKEVSRPKVIGVYDGTIPNGVNFIQIFTEFFNLFKKEKSKNIFVKKNLRQLQRKKQTQIF